jgi:predicted cupin superfamily sugar epimerase
MTQQLIDKYQLEPHPEGGFYRQIYASGQNVISPINGQERKAITQIYFLLQAGQLSRFHMVEHDEIWHHYAGSPLTLIQLEDDTISESTLGGHDGEYVGIVKGGVYQAAESTGEYSLVGCTVAPGFDFSDFSFVEDVDIKNIIIKDYPDYQRFL